MKGVIVGVSNPATFIEARWDFIVVGTYCAGAKWAAPSAHVCDLEHCISLVCQDRNVCKYSSTDGKSRDFLNSARRLSLRITVLVWVPTSVRVTRT